MFQHKCTRSLQIYKTVQGLFALIVLILEGQNLSDGNIITVYMSYRFPKNLAKLTWVEPMIWRSQPSFIHIVLVIIGTKCLQKYYYSSIYIYIIFWTCDFECLIALYSHLPKLNTLNSLKYSITITWSLKCFTQVLKISNFVSTFLSYLCFIEEILTIQY